MQSSGVHVDVALIMWLLILAFAALMIVRRTRLPYTVALVVIGLIVGATHLLKGFQLSSDLVFAVFLPPLLFEAAIHLPVHMFIRNWKPIALLVGPGVVISTILVGYAIHHWIGLGLLLAMQFGALISATDPVSVLARFRRMHVDKRLSTLIEGESLFNDGTAAVLFTALLAAETSGKAISLNGITMDVLRSVVGGVLIGGGVGWGISIIMAQINDHLAEITLTTIAAYGASLLAHSIGTSGVIAVIFSGIILGYYRGEAVMSATTRAAVYSFWEYFAFVVNSLLFLLIGIDVTITELMRNLASVAIAIGVVTAARTVVVYLTGLTLYWTPSRIPLKWLHVLNLAGLRGALAIALAFGVPRNVPGSNIVVAMTYGVVLWTLLPQGLSAGFVLKKLGLVGRGESGEAYERVATMRSAKLASRDELEKARNEGVISQYVYNDFIDKINAELDVIDQQIEQYQQDYGKILDEQKQEVKQRLIAAQQNAIRHALESGIISRSTARELNAQVLEQYGEQEEHR